MKIKVLADRNPKREGAPSVSVSELYGKNKTVESFLAAGGSSRDLAYDVTHVTSKSVAGPPVNKL